MTTQQAAPTEVDASLSDAADADDLGQFGYQQRLKRTMSPAEET